MIAASVAWVALVCMVTRVQAYYVQTSTSRSAARSIKPLPRRIALSSSATSSNPTPSLTPPPSLSPPNRLVALKDKLASTGRAGLLAYGILNFLYYSTVTAVTWRLLLLRSPVVEPGLAFAQRVQATAAKLGSVAGIVWAGSQVTKVFRLSGAVVMAPAVDTLMSWTQAKFRLSSRNAAFWAIIRALWGTLFVFYGGLILYGSAPR